MDQLYRRCLRRRRLEPVQKHEVDSLFVSHTDTPLFLVNQLVSRFYSYLYQGKWRPNDQAELRGGCHQINGVRVNDFIFLLYIALISYQPL